MRYLTVLEVIELHRMVLDQSGGARGLRDRGGLESAVAQPAMSFAQQELYPDLVEKASALCFSLVMNHCFVDGNKRVGHLAMETFLVLNGKAIEAEVEEQEKVILDLASGTMERQAFTEWLQAHIVSR